MMTVSFHDCARGFRVSGGKSPLCSFLAFGRPFAKEGVISFALTPPILVVLGSDPAGRFQTWGGLMLKGRQDVQR